MSRQIKGLLYFFIMDLRYSMIVFWTILLSILFFFMILYYYVIGVENSEFSFGLPFAAYVYCGVLGFLAVKENIPFSLKMGATRKNFFLANGLFFLGISLFFAIAASIIQSVVTFLFSDTSMQSFQFLHLAILLEDTWLNRVIIDSTIMFLVLSIMFIAGLLFYKYGQAGGGIAGGLLILFLLFGVAQGWLTDFIIELFTSIDILFFYQLLLIGLVIYAASFFFLRDISIVKKK